MKQLLKLFLTNTGLLFPLKQLIANLKAAGLSSVKVHFIWSAKYLILGRHIVIFEAIK